MKTLLFTLGMFFLAASRAEPPPLPELPPLFAAVLWDTDGRPYPLAGLLGKPLVVNFWARWCGPCRVEIPELARVQRSFKDRGLRVIGIGLETQADTVRDFARTYDMDYTVLLARDQGSPLMRQLGNDTGGLPYTLVIGPEGRVVARMQGLFRPVELEAALARIFGR